MWNTRRKFWHFSRFLTSSTLQMLIYQNPTRVSSCWKCRGIPTKGCSVKNWNMPFTSASLSTLMIMREWTLDLITWTLRFVNWVITWKLFVFHARICNGFYDTFCYLASNIVILQFIWDEHELEITKLDTKLIQGLGSFSKVINYLRIYFASYFASLTQFFRRIGRPNSS